MRLKYLKIAATIIILMFFIQSNIFYNSKTEASTVEYWALIIGISNYQYVNNLYYASGDAEDIYQTLINHHGWTEDHIYKLLDSEATKSNILDHIERIDNHEDYDDIFLLFFAGHGSQGLDQEPYDEEDGIEEYLIPHDCLGDTETAISDDELSNSLDNLESNKKVIILDTCFSGGFVRNADFQIRSIIIRDLAIEPSITPSTIIDRDFDRNNYVTLTSCDDFEVAYESHELGHGIFTYYLLEGFAPSQPADYNANKMVSAEELFIYAEPKTTSYSNDQHPQLYDGIQGEVELDIKIRITLSDPELLLADSPINKIYFIYPDYTGVKPAGVKYAKVSDWTALGFIIGMCSNRQIEATDTNEALIDPITGKVRLENNVVVITGGPVVNAVLSHYEKERLPPVYWKNINGINFWCYADGTTIEETSLSNTEIKEGQDMFVIESFSDNSDNKILAIYGYSWKGTFAGGKFFKFIMYPNINDYTKSFYIFKWSDNNKDGFVDLEEISTISIAQG